MTQNEKQPVTKFSTNWNKKLNCDFFTTLRLRNDKKYQVGSVHKIMLKENGVFRDYGKATVVALRILRLHQLNEFICGLDTGYSVDETKNILHTMYKEKVPDVNHAEFNLVLFKKEKSQPAQKSMFE